MNKHLHLQLAAGPDAAHGWFDVRAGGPVTGDLTGAALAEGSRDAMVLVPAESVLLTATSVPGQGRQRLMRAVPYALEEQLLDDVDELHFALGKRDADDNLGVAVVARAWLDELVESLSRAGIRPRALVPEPLAVPLTDDEWSVHIEGDRALVRTGPQSGFVTEPDNLAAALKLALVDTVHKPRGICAGGELGSLDGIDELAELPLRRESEGQRLLERIAGQLPTPTVNLLQGDYSPRERMEQAIAPWLPLVVLLPLLAVIYLSGLVLETVEYNERAKALREASVEVYRETFPGARNVPDPRLLMERRLAELKAGGQEQGVLGLLAAIAPVLTAERGLILKNIAFRGERLDIELSIGDLQRLDALKDALAEASGLSTDIVSARRDGDGVNARLRLSRGA